jgi:U32 family peptidase
MNPSSLKSQLPMEVMAPAGSWDSLIAALRAGAGSVYFGVGKLNMRSRSAGNFSSDDLPQIMRLCRSAGAKAYLALNTVMYDQEMEEMKELITLAASAKVDAVIGSDISVLEHASKLGIKVHISTQSNVTNVDAVRFYARYADVMVLARELNLDQVKYISDAIRREEIRGPGGDLVRIEMFAHGALCMAVSGKCYLSLDNMNHSANRGACMQLCRRPYKVTSLDGEIELQVDNEYIMSPKDLCTIHILDRMRDAGVSVLKIEGRGRPADYVSITTRCYLEAAQALEIGDYTEERIAIWQKQLDSVYNRGFWEGYYLGRKLGEWTDGHGSQATLQKTYVGKVTNYYRKLGIAEVLIEARDMAVGDSFMVMGPSTGLVEGLINSLHTDQGPVEKAEKGITCAFPVASAVRRQDKVYKVHPREAEK